MIRGFRKHPCPIPTHHAGLDNVDWGAADDGKKTGAEARQDVAVHVVADHAGRQQRLLDLRRMRWYALVIGKVTLTFCDRM